MLGAAFLLRSRNWLRIHGGRSFALSLWSIGVAAIVVGLLSLAVGHWLVARAIKAAKNNPVTASVPIIMVTTEEDPGKLEAVRQLDVAAVCDKSFPLAVVEKVVDRLERMT